MLCLYGPTAVGKTAAVAALASLPIEVISADSMQVYRGLDVGTAKPDALLLRSVPHHLIDIEPANGSFDVARFVKEATAAASAIRQRGRLPLVVGGTGYYFRHLLYGLPDAPPADQAIRDSLARELEQRGLAELREELRRCDPATADRTAEADSYRTLRALEVYRQTGRPLSSFQRPGARGRAPETPLVELWRPRPELARRISERVDRMMEAGLRDEVTRLVGAGATNEWPSLRAIGYREFFTTEGTLRPDSHLPRIAEEIKSASRRYAKRQQTFANQFPDRLRLHADATGTLAALVRSLVHRLDTI